MTSFVRVLPPAGGVSSPQPANGRSYDPAVASYQDVPYMDAQVLAANGWTAIAPVGTSDARPVTSGPTSGNPEVATRGSRFVDTAIGKLIVFDGVAWRDPATGNAV